MKKFKPNRLPSPEPDGVHTKTRLYNVYLGPGCTHSFKSKRAAETFLNGYARQINHTLHFFNHVLAELYRSHRAAWYYYYDRGRVSNKLQTETRVENLIREAERYMHKAIFNSNGIYTGQGAIWRWLNDVCVTLVEGCTVLAKFLFDRRLYVEAELLKTLGTQARNTLTELERIYGIDK